MGRVCKETFLANAGEGNRGVDQRKISHGPLECWVGRGEELMF